jgi:hypothetical protein
MESDIELDEKYTRDICNSVCVECRLRILAKQSGNKIPGIPNSDRKVEQKEMFIDGVSAVLRIH